MTDAELAEIREELAERESEPYGLGHSWWTIKRLLAKIDELRDARISGVTYRTVEQQEKKGD